MSKGMKRWHLTEQSFAGGTRAAFDYRSSDGQIVSLRGYSAMPSFAKQDLAEQLEQLAQAATEAARELRGEAGKAEGDSRAPDAELARKDEEIEGDYVTVIDELKLAEMRRIQELEAERDNLLNAIANANRINNPARAVEALEFYRGFFRMVSGLVDEWTQDDPHPEESLLELKRGADNWEEHARTVLQALKGGK